MDTQNHKGDVVKIIVLTIIIIASPIILMVIDSVMKHVYSSNTLTSNKIVIYNECIGLFNSYPQYKDIVLFAHNHVKINGEDFSMLENMYFANKLKERYPVFYEKEKYKIAELGKKLQLISCFKAEKSGDFVLFYSIKKFLRFPSPGAVFSLKGKDPNLVDNELLNKNKPFLRIFNDWYASRNLYVSWNRKSNERGLKPLPKPLIDSSLKYSPVVYEE